MGFIIDPLANPDSRVRSKEKGTYKGVGMMNKVRMLTAVALLAFASAAQAQSNKQFHDELFCHDEGLAAYQSLADFHNGLAIDAALQRIDGYLCTDRLPQVCDIKRDMLRKSVRLSYRIGAGTRVMEMSPAQFLQFNDANQSQAVSACMQVVRSRQ